MYSEENPYMTASRLNQQGVGKEFGGWIVKDGSVRVADVAKLQQQAQDFQNQRGQLSTPSNSLGNVVSNTASAAISLPGKIVGGTLGAIGNAISGVGNFISGNKQNVPSSDAQQRFASMVGQQSARQ